MSFENPNLSLSAHVASLNARFENTDTVEMLREIILDPSFGELALVSSFGADSVVLLDMVAKINRALPVIFMDTEMLFHQTLTYQRKLAKDLGLEDVRRIQPSREAVLERDFDNLMHRYDTNACCALRKTEPLKRALAGFGGWISGRKRYQGGARTSMDLFELDAEQRIKINPLAHWSRDDLADYIATHKLPRHPLAAKGFKSIGCAPCTTPVGTVEDERAGRWRGQGKTECGIHFGEVARTVIVTDDGFANDDWVDDFHTFDALPTVETGTLAVDLKGDFPAKNLLQWIDKIDMIRVDFPVFSDGRGFSLACQLRLLGYVGRLRAKGHIVADQYAMARRSGFDEVEIDQALARRQPEPFWQARAKWQANDYQNHLRKAPSQAERPF
ncbi:MAG: phosphoadenylyl-sulfate reductase [Rhodobacteraceae bacterium]|nr:phosphoadenylyl-sulfate reductase [Paracoccaceae bacterium]